MASNIYIVACDDSDKGGIYSFKVNGGVLEPFGFYPVKNANYLAFSSDGRFVYVTQRAETLGSETGILSSFQLNNDGHLRFLDSMSIDGHAGCHLTCDPTGKFLYCANYRSGSLTIFAIDNGRFVEHLQTIKHCGHGPREDRQECAHVHCVALTPDKKYLAVVDLGIDSIFLYKIDKVRGLEESSAYSYSLPAGVGPRHIIFNKMGDIAYVVNELDNSVAVLNYETGKINLKQIISTLPEYFTTKNTTAAIRLSQDEKFLLVSNRGHDSIACFAVKNDRTLSLVEIVSTEGKGPRDFNLIGDNKLLIAANEDSNEVTVFHFDNKTGDMKFTNQKIILPQPLCVVEN